MTAFNEVLAAEQEAERAIETARNEAVAAVAAAKTNQGLRLEAEAVKLQAVEQSSLVSHEKHIANLVEKIQSDVQVKVVTLENRFATHKADLKTTLKKSF